MIRKIVALLVACAIAMTGCSTTQPPAPVPQSPSSDVTSPPTQEVDRDTIYSVYTYSNSKQIIVDAGYVSAS